MWCVGFLLSLQQGFDEYMNIVLDNADEINLKTKTKKPIGSSSSIFSVF